MSDTKKQATKSGRPAGKKATAKKSGRKSHASAPAKKIPVKTKTGAQLDNSAIHKGAIVEWAWGVNRAVGKVMEVFSEKVRRTLKGKVITRNATPQKRSALIKTPNGGRALKSVSELKAPSKRPAKPTDV